MAENLHRHDLTKEQRDEHIRRYAELLEAQAAAPNTDAECATIRGRGQPKGTARKIADATGLSKDTVRRALNPKPAPRRVIEIPDQLDHDDMIQLQVRSLMAARSKLSREAPPE